MPLKLLILGVSICSRGTKVFCGPCDVDRLIYRSGERDSCLAVYDRERGYSPLDGAIEVVGVGRCPVNTRARRLLDRPYILPGPALRVGGSRDQWHQGVDYLLKKE